MEKKAKSYFGLSPVFELGSVLGPGHRKVGAWVPQPQQLAFWQICSTSIVLADVVVLIKYDLKSSLLSTPPKISHSTGSVLFNKIALRWKFLYWTRRCDAFPSYHFLETTLHYG